MLNDEDPTFLCHGLYNLTSVKPDPVSRQADQPYTVVSLFIQSAYTLYIIQEDTYEQDTLSIACFIIFSISTSRYNQ